MRPLLIVVCLALVAVVVLWLAIPAANLRAEQSKLTEPD